MSKRIETELMVLRALKSSPKTHADLVTHTGINRETVRLALARMKHAGVIVEEDRVFRAAPQEQRA